MKLSVLIPAKNQSEKLLRHLRDSIIPYFDLAQIDYEIVICTDGGRLDEHEVLEKEIPSLPANVRLLPLEDIKGKGHAVKKAILASDAEYVLFMDADLATSLDVFDAIKPELGNVDCFIASRDVKGSQYGQKQPFMRRLTHWGCRKVVSWTFHMKGIKDTQCGYKCIRTEDAKKAAALSIIDGFAFDVELLYILYLNGRSIRELPCLWTDDPDSSVGSPIKTAKKFYADVRRIKKNKKNYYFAEVNHAD